jgi:hypothetical protein
LSFEGLLLPNLRFKSVGISYKRAAYERNIDYPRCDEELMEEVDDAVEHSSEESDDSLVEHEEVSEAEEFEQEEESVPSEEDSVFSVSSCRLCTEALLSPAAKVPA